MLKVFFSYSHKDEATRDELEIHLAMLKRQGVIETWHDRRIIAGDDFVGQISEHLESADVVLLLVSPYFLASAYCYDIEMSRALQRQQEGVARLIPVIVDPCDWKRAPFGGLLALPVDGKPISKFPNVHDAFLEVVNAIREVSKSTQPTACQPTQKVDQSYASAVEGARSSNLRIRRQFTKHDRDVFRERTFEYVATYIEGSLAELEKRHSEVATRFKRVDTNTFTAVIYEGGVQKAQCAICLSDNFGGDQIAFSADLSSRGSSCNELVRVVDDGTSLGWKSTFGFRAYDQGKGQLTQAGVAEYFWSRLIEPLQS